MSFTDASSPTPKTLGFDRSPIVRVRRETIDSTELGNSAKFERLLDSLPTFRDAGSFPSSDFLAQLQQLHDIGSLIRLASRNSLASQSNPSDTSALRRLRSELRRASRSLSSSSSSLVLSSRRNSDVAITPTPQPEAANSGSLLDLSEESVNAGTLRVEGTGQIVKQTSGASMGPKKSVLVGVSQDAVAQKDSVKPQKAFLQSPTAKLQTGVEANDISSQSAANGSLNRFRLQVHPTQIELSLSATHAPPRTSQGHDHLDRLGVRPTVQGKEVTHTSNADEHGGVSQSFEIKSENVGWSKNRPLDVMRAYSIQLLGNCESLSDLGRVEAKQSEGRLRASTVRHRPALDVQRICLTLIDHGPVGITNEHPFHIVKSSEPHLHTSSFETVQALGQLEGNESWTHDAEITKQSSLPDQTNPHVSNVSNPTNTNNAAASRFWGLEGSNRVILESCIAARNTEVQETRPLSMAAHNSGIQIVQTEIRPQLAVESAFVAASDVPGCDIQNKPEDSLQSSSQGLQPVHHDILCAKLDEFLMRFSQNVQHSQASDQRSANATASYSSVMEAQIDHLLESIKQVSVVDSRKVDQAVLLKADDSRSRMKRVGVQRSAQSTLVEDEDVRSLGDLADDLAKLLEKLEGYAKLGTSDRRDVFQETVVQKKSRLSQSTLDTQTSTSFISHPHRASLQDRLNDSSIYEKGASLKREQLLDSDEKEIIQRVDLQPERRHSAQRQAMDPVNLAELSNLLFSKDSQEIWARRPVRELGRKRNPASPRPPIESAQTPMRAKLRRSRISSSLTMQAPVSPPQSPHSHVYGRFKQTVERHSTLLIENEDVLSDFRKHIEDRFGLARCFQKSFQEMDVCGAGRINKVDFETLVPRLVGFHAAPRDLRRLFLLADAEDKGYITVTDWLKIKALRPQYRFFR